MQLSKSPFLVSTPQGSCKEKHLSPMCQSVPLTGQALSEVRHSDTALGSIWLMRESTAAICNDRLLMSSFKSATAHGEWQLGQKFALQDWDAAVSRHTVLQDACNANSLQMACRVSSGWPCCCCDSRHSGRLGAWVTSTLTTHVSTVMQLHATNMVSCQQQQQHSR